jgi:rRNA N6-adenosine-methyltransferase METTL5
MPCKSPFILLNLIVFIHFANIISQDIAPFAKPKIELEQYPTGPHLAARLLYTVRYILVSIDLCGQFEISSKILIVFSFGHRRCHGSSSSSQVAHSYDEFEGQVVADLGCGTAMLSIGAAILGACHVIAIDLDSDALEIAKENIDEFEDPPLPIDLVQSSVQAIVLQPRIYADTVIMNPPFGTRTKGADMDFLRAAFKISRHSIYSLHKSSTREHIGKIAIRDLKAKSAEVLAQLRYDLPATYKFHKQKSRDIEVDLWRFEVPDRKEEKVNNFRSGEGLSRDVVASKKEEELSEEELQEQERIHNRAENSTNSEKEEEE